MKVLEEIEPLVDGFTVTSIKDLKNVRGISKKSIHFVSPLIREKEIREINLKGNSVSFNSIESFKRMNKHLNDNIKIFVRINPELSFLDDDRYDPCRNYSKLGISLKDFIHCFDSRLSTSSIYGIHFHTNCQSENPEELELTLSHIEKHLGKYLHRFEEVNLGGGYLYSQKLVEMVNQLQSSWHKKYGIFLRMEPSFDISNSAGFLCSTIVDIFQNQGKNIAVLDTAINHLPEMFEYGDRPEILELEKASQSYSYILAGATCLAGDVFGEYSFPEPLKIGDVITFKNVGSYSLVRADTFNGIPIPDTYVGLVNNNIIGENTRDVFQIERLSEPSSTLLNSLYT